MTEIQAEYVRIANARYNGNYRHFNELPADLKATIARTNNFSHLDGGKSVLSSMPGKDIAEKLHEWKKAEGNAERAVQQQLDRESITRSKTAKELRVEYLQNKSNIDPLKRRHHERELKIALKELEAENAELAAQAAQAQVKQQIESNTRYRNAVEHAEATLALAESTDEKTDALIQLKLLQSVSSLDQIENRVVEYWQQEAKRSERQTLAEMNRATETTQSASEAVAADSAQQSRVIESQRKADMARQNAEYTPDA